MEHPLRTYRRSRGITLDQLANETGLSKSHLSEIEGGKTPGSKTIATLVQKTGLGAGIFFALPSPDGGPLAVARPVISSAPSVSVAGSEGSTDEFQEVGNIFQGADNVCSG